MDAKEAKQLLIKTVVMWDNNPADLGIVTELNLEGFLVEWQNGQKGWIDYQDAQKVERQQ
jgi:hypothetical protein